MSKQTKNYTPGLAVLFILFFIIGISFALPSTARTNVPEEKQAPVPPSPYDATRIEAKAAIVYDTKTQQVLFAKNKETPLPLASITKLMTAYVALTKIPNAVVTIRPEDILPEGDSGLLVGEKWTVPNLAAFTLMTSSNDGAHALARAAAAANNLSASALLSTEAQKLSLSQSYFLNANGLDISPKVSGGYGSALDVAHLLTKLYTRAPEVLLAASKPAHQFYSQSGIQHSGKNTNIIADKLPSLLGTKTGFTDLAGGNLAVLIDIAPGRPIAIVVLDSTVAGRFRDVEQLTNMTLNYFAQKEEVL